VIRETRSWSEILSSYDRIEHLFPRGEHRVEFSRLRDRTRENRRAQSLSLTHERQKDNPKTQVNDTRFANEMDAYSRDDDDRRESFTYPFLHAWLFSSWSLIMPTMMSSETSPPASMIFFASTPSAVFLTTCSRSMSPVARWQTQKSSRIRGACVPLPEPRQQPAHTTTSARADGTGIKRDGMAGCERRTYLRLEAR